MKGILNKLTPEKFERLLEQLVDNVTDAEVLHATIRLVFENAVAQPTFVPMYAELCDRLSKARCALYCQTVHGVLVQWLATFFGELSKVPCVRSTFTSQHGHLVMACLSLGSSVAPLRLSLSSDPVYLVCVSFLFVSADPDLSACPLYQVPWRGTL